MNKRATLKGKAKGAGSRRAALAGLGILAEEEDRHEGAQGARKDLGGTVKPGQGSRVKMCQGGGRGVAVPPADDGLGRAQALAEAGREAVMVDELEIAREWGGVELRPWSEERARLLDALCALDVPMPSLLGLDVARFVDAYFPRACKALYLLCHDPEDWQGKRPRLLELVEAWAAEAVPAGTFAEKAAAVSLVVQIENAHRKVMALVKPERKGRAAVGN